jgi:hypothetical protein
MQLDRPYARVFAPFAAIIALQGVHSIEEYAGKLWLTFPPAAFASGLVSSNKATGFIILNILIVSFGVWTALVPVRRGWPSARGLLWIWIFVESMNGIVHPLLSVIQRGYTAGLYTSLLLLPMAIFVARRVREEKADSSSSSALRPPPSGL